MLWREKRRRLVVQHLYHLFRYCIVAVDVVAVLDELLVTVFLYPSTGSDLGSAINGFYATIRVFTACLKLHEPRVFYDYEGVVYQ